MLRVLIQLDFIYPKALKNCYQVEKSQCKLSNSIFYEFQIIFGTKKAEP